jgi:TetR/AcrR family transcriptional repressor of nem operon
VARYPKEHKERTHRQIVSVASTRFRRDGIAATGLAPLMAEAGLTHGGFYAHFATKDALVREAAALALRETRDYLASEAARVPPERQLEAIVDGYLRRDHRDHPEFGCAAAALGAELARQSRESRVSVQSALRALIEVIAEALPESLSAEVRQQRAEGVFAVMLGALQLARTVTNKAWSDRLLAAGREAALRIADA